MIKKLLAALLAMMMLIGICAVFAVADEPVEKPDYYVMEDDDFTSLVKYTEGNDKATILYPGDNIYMYVKGTGKKEISVTYYPDVDANAAGEWRASDANITAFSLSAKASFTDRVNKYVAYENGNQYTVLGMDQSVNVGTPDEAEFDYTICYPESNTFVGWVVYTYELGTKNMLVLYGLWEKNVSEDDGEEEVDDLPYILDTNISWLQKLTAPFLAFNKQIVNSILDQLQDVLDKMTGTETEDNGDIGVYQASIQSFKIAAEIFMRWLDSWVTPVVELFD